MSSSQLTKNIGLCSLIEDSRSTAWLVGRFNRSLALSAVKRLEHYDKSRSVYLSRLDFHTTLYTRLELELPTSIINAGNTAYTKWVEFHIWVKCSP